MMLLMMSLPYHGVMVRFYVEIKNKTQISALLMSLQISKAYHIITMMNTGEYFFYFFLYDQIL